MYAKFDFDLVSYITTITTFIITMIHFSIGTSIITTNLKPCQFITHLPTQLFNFNFKN